MISAFNPYNTLPVADEALNLGGEEMLRAGFADQRLFVSLRNTIDTPPERWGEVLAEITVNLATLYSMNGNFTDNEVIAEVAGGFRDTLRKFLGTAESAASTPEPKAKQGKSGAPKSARPLARPPAKKAKAPAKPKAAVKTPLKAKAKSPANKPPANKPLAKKSLAKKPLAKKPPVKSKAAAGRKGARG